MNKHLKIITLLLSVFILGFIIFYYKKNPSPELVERNSTEVLSKSQKKKWAPQDQDKAETFDQKNKPTSEPQFNQNLRLVEDGEEKELSFLDMDAIEELFDEVEENWANKIKKLFVEELKLTPEVYQKYQSLRDEYDFAKLEAYEAYHERMIEQHGAEYPYQASLQVEEFDNVALPEFYKRLEAEIGLDALRQYIRVKDDFNEELRKNQPPGPAQILIDF